MTPDRAGKMAGIKEQIEQGRYQIDPRAVADAMIRRGWPLLELRPRYSECSYPDSSMPESPNRTPPVP